MKTITKFQVQDDGSVVALFFFLWHVANHFFYSAGNDSGIFMQSYYIRLPFHYTFQYGKDARYKKAIVSLYKQPGN